jgi:hypothetical protein
VGQDSRDSPETINTETCNDDAPRAKGALILKITELERKVKELSNNFESGKAEMNKLEHKVSEERRKTG